MVAAGGDGDTGVVKLLPLPTMDRLALLVVRVVVHFAAADCVLVSGVVVAARLVLENPPSKSRVGGDVRVLAYGWWLCMFGVAEGGEISLPKLDVG